MSSTGQVNCHQTNSDSHGKNISFFVEPGGLRLAPAYDLVAVCVYPKIDHELAMAYGDEFDITKVRAYDWAELASRCHLDRKLIAREMLRMTKALRKVIPALASGEDYNREERERVLEIVQFCLAQAEQLESDAALLPKVEID